MKTREQVDELKTQWESDPCWDIEGTEGFEDYADELREYRAICEYQWREERAEQGQSTALQQAKLSWEDALHYQESGEPIDDDREFSESLRQDAATLAAIAQAEALTRIAEVLETMLDDQTHERTQRLRALAQRNELDAAAEELGL